MFAIIALFVFFSSVGRRVEAEAQRGDAEKSEGGDRPEEAGATEAVRTQD